MLPLVLEYGVQKYCQDSGDFHLMNPANDCCWDLIRKYSGLSGAKNVVTMSAEALSEAEQLTHIEGVIVSCYLFFFYKF